MFTVAMSNYFKFSKFNCWVLAYDGQVYLPEHFGVTSSATKYPISKATLEINLQQKSKV